MSEYMTKHLSINGWNNSNLKTKQQTSTNTVGNGAVMTHKTKKIK